MKPRLDHVGRDVSDHEVSRAFYEQALAPLGMSLVMEPVPNAGGFGDDMPFFWIARRERGPDSGVLVAFSAADRETVDAFRAAALVAGGADNGGPGLRELYHPNPYGAFVLDPDGNNIEAVRLTDHGHSSSASRLSRKRRSASECTSSSARP